MDWLEYGVLFAVAAVVTIALTPLARKLAIKLDAIDYPSARRVNMLPIPRMGGVAIFGGILAALAVAGFGVYAFGGLTLSSTTTALKSTIGALCWARF